MTRGTTPTYVVKFDDEEMDFSQVDVFYLTLKQKDNIITEKFEHDSPDVNPEEKTVTWTLTQDQTLTFKEGEAELQVRGKFTDDTAFATKVYRVPVNRVLYDEVI